MRFQPHQYQQRAIDFILDHPRCLLFLDMGLGKTVSTLTAISELQNYGEAERVLVVAPKKVAESTWSTEVAKWDHLRLTTSKVIGTPAQRTAALQAKADIYVIGRDSIPWLVTECKKDRKWPFDMVVLDELTSFKNPSSLRFKAMKAVLPMTHRVVGLTGTPTPNGLIDLWAQVYCIDGGERLFKSVTRYRDAYFHVVEHNHIPIKIYPRKGSQEEIMNRISDITLSMRAEDWLTMPPMTITDVPVGLPTAVMNRYRKFEKEKVMEAIEDGTEITASSAATLLGKLSQFANGAVYDEEKNVTIVHEEKLSALDEIVESVGGSVLCFYQYQHDRNRIVKHYGDKMRVRVYEGEQDLNDWNEGKIDLLLAHPASTAFGLNMQSGGSVIVWFSTGWNLELYQQANARLHRQGQKHPVRVFNLVAGGTVDERMVLAIRGKEETQTNVMKRLAREIINSNKK